MSYEINRLANASAANEQDIAEICTREAACTAFTSKKKYLPHVTELQFLFEKAYFQTCFSYFAKCADDDNELVIEKLKAIIRKTFLFTGSCLHRICKKNIFEKFEYYSENLN